ncbi:S41 family peptidase [Rhodocytophaga rosea]|uniref:S41 family peptidase n=1 Tax=Rhodocytophaga rosea TaxID=2704465 RepID=A0A6C0GS64_9BACT|nr:S41 family peptidase [Rhodocytophaga rosea]QHT70918.1 S41 family peptidase [Rhodocytophaga rosea]
MKTLLLCFLICFAGLLQSFQALSQTALPKPVITPAVTRKLIDTISQTLERYYIFPDKAVQMGQHLQQQRKKGIYRTIKDAHQLAGQLTRDMESIYADGHLYMSYDPDLSKAILEVNPDKRRREDSLALLSARESNFGLNRVEILDGNIGYLPVYSFTRFVSLAKPSFSSALRFLSHTQALILDLRYNGGGSPEMVGQLGSYFFSVSTPFTSIYNRRIDSSSVYWADPARAEGVTLSMPVYILTSSSTFSAGEDFAYSMQQSKRATVVGDTTGGGAHPAGPFVLGDGFILHLPFAQSINPYSKTNWEGTGVIPDMAASAEEALQMAHKLILQQFIQQATDDKQKRKLLWAVHALDATSNTHTIDQQALAHYTGDYNGLIVYLQEEKLYCKNTGRGNQITQLQEIKKDWFVLNEQVHVEFIKEDGKNFSLLKLHWRDGREIPVYKSK